MGDNEMKSWNKRFPSIFDGEFRIVINGAGGTFIETWKESETPSGRTKTDYIVHNLTTEDLIQLRDFLNESLPQKED